MGCCFSKERYDIDGQMSSVGETVLDKSKLSVDLKRDVTIAADNEDILNSEFAKIQDEAYQIFFVKNKMNKDQIYQT